MQGRGQAARDRPGDSRDFTPKPSRCPALIRLCPLTVRCTVTPLPRVSAVPRAGNGHAMGKQELRPTPRCQSRARDEPWAAARGDTDSSLYGRSQAGGHPGDSVPLRYRVEPGSGGGSRMRGRAEPLWGELAPGAGLSHLLLGGVGCEGPAPSPLDTCRPPQPPPFSVRLTSASSPDTARSCCFCRSTWVKCSCGNCVLNTARLHSDFSPDPDQDSRC